MENVHFSKSIATFALSAALLIALCSCNGGNSSAPSASADASSATASAQPQIDASTSSDATSSQAVSSKTYSDINVTFSYPGSWQPSKYSGEDGGGETFTDPAQNNATVLTYVTGEASNMQLRTTDQFQAAYAPIFDDFAITSLASVKVGGYDATELIFTYTLDNVQYVETRYNVAVGPIYQGFFCMCPSASSDAYKQSFASLIASVQFTAGPPATSSKAASSKAVTSSKAATSSQTASTKTYSSASVTFKYPNGWKYTKSAGEDGSSATFTDPALNNTAVLTYVVGEASNMTLSTKQQFQDAYSELYQNFAITSFTNTTVGGNAANKLVFTYTSSENIKYTKTMYNVVVNKLKYRGFYFVCPSSNSDAYKQSYSSIIASVKFAS